MILFRSRMHYPDPAKQAVVDRYNQFFDENERGARADWGEIFAELIAAYVDAKK